MKKIFRLRIVVISLLTGILFSFVYLMPGCNDTSSEDTTNLSDTASEDTGPTDTDSSENVTHKSGAEITSAQKWSGTHTLEGNLYIKAAIEINPCTKILIAPRSKIRVSDNGSIKAIGREECPIIFTSAKQTAGKGDWYEIDIYKTSSSDNAFEWTVFEFGGGNDYGMLWVESEANIYI